ncbi:MAG: hypothetical protein ACRECV_13580 [Xanthobacteraceae bacterium]
MAVAVTATALGAMLGGCSDSYMARSDTIALGAGDAIAANEAMQTMDPWSPQSGNTNIPANGQRMQAAVERYRTDKPAAVVDPMQTTGQQQQQQQTVVNNNIAPPTPSTTSSSGQ